MNVLAQCQPAGGSAESGTIGPIPRHPGNAGTAPGGFTTLLAQALELPDASANPEPIAPSLAGPSSAPGAEVTASADVSFPPQTGSRNTGTTITIRLPGQAAPTTTAKANLQPEELQNAAGSLLPGSVLPPAPPTEPDPAPSPGSSSSGQSTSAEETPTAELALPGVANKPVSGVLKVRSSRRQDLRPVKPEAKTASIHERGPNGQSLDASASQPAGGDTAAASEAVVIQLNPAQMTPTESPVVLLGLFGAVPIPVPSVNPVPVPQAGRAAPRDTGTTGVVSTGAGPTEGVKPEISIAPGASAGAFTAPEPRPSPPDPDLAASATFRGEATGRILPEVTVQVQPGKSSQNSPNSPDKLETDAGPRPTVAADTLFQADPSRGAGLGPVLTDGTASAQDIEQMKQRLKSDEIADLAGKNLPEVMAAPVVSKSKNLTRLAVRSAGTVEGDLALTASSSARMRTLSSQAVASEAPQASPVARLFNGILEEATIVRHLRPDSLSVVIKPDSQTEIFVRLEMRDGRLEAAARCDRGDYQFLSAHWPELRQSLQHQGVRLQDLQQRPEGLSLNSGNLGDSSQPRRQASLPGEATPALAPSVTRSKSTVLTARSAAKALAGKRLLESWA